MRANIFKDIEKEKLKLIERAKKKGLYEDFGQKEYKKLSDKWSSYASSFPESSKAIAEQLQGFFDWCINFNGKQNI